MGHQKKRKGKRHSETVGRRSRRPVIILILLAVIGTAVAAVIFFWEREAGISEKAPSPVAKPGERTALTRKTAEDFQKLIGRWIRPDGGYVIEIRSISSDGRLDASYLNPRPINIARAEARSTDKDLGIFLELQDVGYPGSTYTLNYNEGRDILYGAYFQAAMGQTFDVVFVRIQP